MFSFLNPKSGIQNPKSCLNGVFVQALYKRFFLKLGFGEVIDKALEMFPELGGKLEAAIVSEAITERDEGADLSNDLKNVGIKIQVERFLDPPDLRKYLRHELMHASDMLDDHLIKAGKGVGMLKK